MTTLKPRTASHIIYQGDDLAHLAELRQAAELAKRQAQTEYDRATRGPVTVKRIGDADDSVDTAKAAYDEAVRPTQDAYDAAVDEAAGRAVEVVVQAIGPRRFRDLLAQHEPRQKDGETHPDDREFGVNDQTFPWALLRYEDDDNPEIRTILAPEFSKAKRRAFLEDELSDGDFEQLWTLAYTLNRGLGRNPKASKYLSGSPRSIET